MSVETKSDVEQFLALQKKSELELRAICEGMGLATEGNQQDLIDHILELKATPQNSVLIPQALPLRTRDSNSQPLDAAIKAMRTWRRMIFKAKGNIKQFSLINSKGQSYISSLGYLKCSSETMLKILEQGWVLPLKQHRDLIQMLKKDPDKFSASIIQKPDTNGNSWLMLHVEPRQAAA